jgi:hypothetical protein
MLTLEAPPEEVLPALQRALEHVLGTPLTWHHAAVHRSALRAGAGAGCAGPVFAWDPQSGLGACGDHLGGGGIEAAFLSGRGAGARHARPECGATCGLIAPRSPCKVSPEPTLALEATVYKAQLQIADIDAPCTRTMPSRSRCTLRRPRSGCSCGCWPSRCCVPADTDRGALQFARRPADADQPDLWQPDLTGGIPVGGGRPARRAAPWRAPVAAPSA